MSAVRSALRQTYPRVEVIVVVDGPDPETEARLDAIPDSRLRMVLLPEPCGGSEARNAGVRAARGEWIAFLDDDDEWLPEKIERQMRAARHVPDWFPVLSCRLIAQSPSSSRVLPLRPYESPQPIGDFLLCRPSLLDPGGIMQTSTLLAPRDLLLAVPFQPGLLMHQDLDWLIRVSSHSGVGLHMLPQPLTVYRVGGDRASVGRNPDWRFSLSWIRHSRPLLSRRAFSWFIAVQCAWRAQESRAGILAHLRLLCAFLEGRPEWLSLLYFVIFTFVPAGLRRNLRARLCRNGSESAQSASGLQLVFTRPPAAPALRDTRP